MAYPKVYKKKITTKKAIKPSKALTLAVKRIVAKQTETKQWRQTAAANFIATDDARFHNVEYYIGQGVGDNQRVGDEVLLVGTRMRIRTVVPSTSNANNPGVTRGSPVYVRLSLIKTKINDTSALTNWWSSPLSLQATKQSSSMPDIYQHWDSEKVQCLKTVMKTYTYQFVGSGSPDGYMDIYVPLNFKQQYAGNNSGYGKVFNHYWAIEYFQQGQAAGVSSSLAFDSEMTVYYKDM